MALHLTELGEYYQRVRMTEEQPETVALSTERVA